jgi:hypothetical protein
MKGIVFFKGCAVAIIGLAFMRLYGPIFEDKPYNTNIDWFDLLLVIGFGIIYYFFLNKSLPEKN